jgi:hypothetical protein
LKNNPDHQPYDSTLKGLFETEAAGIIPYLVPGVRLKGTPLQAERNVELNRTTLSADKVYWAFYKDVTILLHIELQVKPSAAFCRRILAYNGSLHNEFEVPVLSLVIFPFEYGSPDLFYEEKCADEVFASIRPKVICLRDLDSEKIVREHRLSLYVLLPTTKRPTVHLLTQALEEMHKHYDEEEFINHITWFVCLMDRTKTMSDEEKLSIEEVLHMQYQIDPLLRESPTIRAILAKDLSEATAKARAEALAQGKAEGKAEGLAKGLQEAILDLVSDHFPALVVSQVQQTITTTQDIEQLRKFHRQVARVSDEQEVSALLAQCFPPQDSIRAIAVQNEAKGLREAILEFVNARFSPHVITEVQQTIEPIQDVEQLKMFFRQLVRVHDEEEVYASLAQCFWTHRD